MCCASAIPLQLVCNMNYPKKSVARVGASQLCKWTRETRETRGQGDKETRGQGDKETIKK